MDIPWVELPEGISPEARDLLEQLLCEDPAQRLGSKGAQEVKDHPFFKGINWGTLLEQPGVFVPKLGDLTDTTYFWDRTDLYGRPGSSIATTQSYEEISPEDAEKHWDNFSFTNYEVLKNVNKKAGTEQ
eukprot:TRINITY_DN930_c0_g3_i1.p1 TRINITY_DN930_c0_g3~~TRINITY_DN930_c0_g3_i1.p1  ORF type:complete len:129 (-),score=28.46 TRINITY_DN930_c0_g3_i1:46-432(-)